MKKLVMEYGQVEYRKRSEIHSKIIDKCKNSTLLWRITENDLRTILGDTIISVENDRQTIEPTDNFWENLKYGCPEATIDENTDFNDILKFSFI